MKRPLTDKERLIFKVRIRRYLEWTSSPLRGLWRWWVWNYLGIAFCPACNRRTRWRHDLLLVHFDGQPQGSIYTCKSCGTETSGSPYGCWDFLLVGVLVDPARMDELVGVP